MSSSLIQTAEFPIRVKCLWCRIDLYVQQSGKMLLCEPCQTHSESEAEAKQTYLSARIASVQVDVDSKKEMPYIRARIADFLVLPFDQMSDDQIKDALRDVQTKLNIFFE